MCSEETVRNKARMKRIVFRFGILLLLAASVGTLAAQRLWTLEECIDYAIANNISIQQQNLEIQSREVQLNSSKNAWLPDLNLNVGEEVSFGNYNFILGLIDDDTDANNDLSYTTGRLAMTMPLFNGFRLQNTAKSDRFRLEAAVADLEKARKDLGIQIAVRYLECLYQRSMADVARSQVDVSRKLVDRARLLVQDGRRPLSDQAEAEAQLANDEYLLAEAEGQVRLARLALSQLLNLDSMENFDVAELDADGGVVEYDDLPLPDGIFDNTVESFPSIQSAKAQIESGKAQVKVARSAFYPSLALQGYAGAFYVKMFNRDFDFDVSDSNFFRDCMNEVVALHLSIPIFNRTATKNNVRLAEIGVRNRELALDEARLSLRKEIQTAYYNADVARNKLAAAEKAVDASNVSVGYEEKRYDTGRSNLYDLQLAQQKHLKALQNVTQAKYEYLIRQRVLRFYCE